MKTMTSIVVTSAGQSYLANKKEILASQIDDKDFNKNKVRSFEWGILGPAVGHHW